MRFIEGETGKTAEQSSRTTGELPQLHTPEAFFTPEQTAELQALFANPEVTVASILVRLREFSHAKSASDPSDAVTAKNVISEPTNE